MFRLDFLDRTLLVFVAFSFLQELNDVLQLLVPDPVCFAPRSLAFALFPLVLGEHGFEPVGNVLLLHRDRQAQQRRHFVRDGLVVDLKVQFWTMKSRKRTYIASQLCLLREQSEQTFSSVPRPEAPVRRIVQIHRLRDVRTSLSHRPVNPQF